MYQLFIDSDCDITLEEANEYGAKFISMPYIEDDKEIYPYETWKEFDSHGFYQRLREGKMATTCAISPEAYKEKFREEFAKGNDILYAHFSTIMSATFNAMRLALEELKEEFPERKFYEIDAKGITIGARSLVLEVMKLYKAGKSVEELLKFADDEVQHFAVYFFADNLKFFKRSGRVTGFKALMGNLVGVKPIIYMDEEGKMVNIGRAKGRQNALQTLLDKVIELEEDIRKYPVVIAHTDNEELANELGKMVKAHFGEDLLITYNVVNPTAGAHCGPDTIGISFHAKHR